MYIYMYIYIIMYAAPINISVVLRVAHLVDSTKLRRIRQRVICIYK